MANENRGSFGAAIGGSQALTEAMERRGIDVSALQVTSPASAGGAPPIPQDPSQLDAAQVAIGQPPSGATTPTPAAAPPPPPTDPELMVAMEALGTFVKSAGSTRKELAKARVSGIV
ncbi:hypothetical protein LCGC14_1023990 [marine sediment metagenome]|uniref:Uncharacterized protein n=1 Tax=marine sediment metagenome TaxID=412755 RepID=A0A0F9NI82_9ZZZZ